MDLRGLRVPAPLFGPWIAPHDADRSSSANATLQPPVWQEGGSWEFILGTDPLGRDMLSRLIVGARYSFFVGVVVVSIAASGGILIGLIAGFAPKWLDAIIMRIMDIILAFPSLLLALVLVAILGPSPDQCDDRHRDRAAAALRAPDPRARSCRRSRRTMSPRPASPGPGGLRLMFVTVLPNCLAPIIVQAALSFSTAILDAAALGFLGMGAQPPTPEWGTMLAEAREFILRAWWVVTFPGLAILVTVLAINLMGDGLRDALDPKLKRS